MSEADEKLAHSLVPLKLAVLLVWQRVYEARIPPNGRREDVLDSIAAMLLTTEKVWEFGTDPGRRARRLCLGEIAGGIFRGGGEELCFPDARPPLRFLAISADALSAAIESLKRAPP